MLLNKKIVDPQGSEFKKATLLVVTSYLTTNNVESFNVSNKDYESEIINLKPNNTLRYRVVYWPNDELRTKGKAPYPLMNFESPNTDEHFASLDDGYKGLNAKDAAEKHLLDYVLPKLK